MSPTADEGAVPDDHPNGPEIRRQVRLHLITSWYSLSRNVQVEYYFSDENLRTDFHLLKCCGGRENLPVSISRICGFNKMRGFKGKGLILAALRKSTFLKVSEDGKQISRKVPLQGPCAIDPGFYENDDDISFDPRAQKPAVQPIHLLPQMRAQSIPPSHSYPSYVGRPTELRATMLQRIPCQIRHLPNCDQIHLLGRQCSATISRHCN